MASDGSGSKKRTNKKVTVLIVLLIILAVLVAAAAFLLTRSKPEPETPLDFNREVGDENEETAAADTPTVDEDAANSALDQLDGESSSQPTRDEGWSHYLLLGMDGETDSYTAKRSDAMIVLSVNQDEGRVVLSSVPRDTLVYIDGKNGFDKLTHAYAYGGADLTVQTFEQNFDIDIENYFTVNFAAMEEIVDLVGGVTITMTDAEAKHMGEYYAAWGLSGGTQVLNGKEALAYCRIRKIDSDYKRNDRQFAVLMAIYDEVKDLSVGQYTELISTVYNHMYTDMTLAGAISLVGDLLSVTENGTIENVKLVDSEHSSAASLDGRSVVLVDNLEQTAIRWREALDIDDYEPSARLKQISEALEELK